MKYFRSYPWGMQILLFLLMVFTFMSAAGFIVPTILTRMTGFLPSQIENIGPNSSAALVRVTLIIEGILNFFIFLLPAFLFAYLSHPRPAEYLGLRMPGKKIHFVLAILVILGAMPLLQGLESLIGQINFGPKIKADQQANDNMMTAFLNMPSVGSFLRVFLLLAIVPAVGEELFFRGVLLRLAKKRSANMVFPILFTAAVFAYAHTNIYGYLSIFLAGVLLAVIYNLTGSLWCNIIAHMFFNGTQIILTYMGKTNAGVKAFMDSNTVPYYLLIGGAIVFGVSFYLLLKNKTPLTTGWENDFTLQELLQKED